MLPLSQKIAHTIRARLLERLAQTGHMGDTLKNPTDLKSSHGCDDIALAAAGEVLADEPAQVFLESEGPAIYRADANYSLYIDPVDGSLNWDRGVGDPCVVIARSPKLVIDCLDDLSDAYVLGLRSGDEYWTEEGRSYYRCALTGEKREISTRLAALEQATAYLRPGYGFAERHLARTRSLYGKVRDIRAVDNSGTELCEIARGAAHLMAETRGASDVFNLMAWPILRHAGGVLLDLQGDSLQFKQLHANRPLDFIAAASYDLAVKALYALR